MDIEKTKRALNQEDWKRTQLRIPHEEYEKVMQFAEKNNVSLNTAILQFIEEGLKQQEKAISGRSIYFNDINCIEDYKNEPLHNQLERVEQKISNLFYENPQYQLINIETLSDGKKVRYWYSIPRSESFRN